MMKTQATIASAIEPVRFSPAKLLTPAEVGEWLALAPQTLAHWRMRGQGPPFVKVGRVVRYRAADVQAWLDSKCMVSTQGSSLANRGGH